MSTTFMETPTRKENEQQYQADVDPTLDSLQLLLREAGRFQLLTPAEEIELAKRIEKGDLVAKDRMINSNLRLVVANARRYQGQGLALGDLIQEGMLGLIRAVEKFDWRKGFRFSTYATLWIRQAIQRGLENTSRTIRLPVHVAQRSRKVGRIERELTTKLGHEPTDEEIAVAESQRCVRSNITQMVDRLETEGLVRRVDDPVDGRVVRALLTARGRERQERGAEVFHAIQAEITAALPSTDRESLERALTALNGLPRNTPPEVSAS